MEDGEQRPLLPTGNDDATLSTIDKARRQTRRFLASTTGHYSVLLLVCLDVGVIFADLFLQLLSCEGRVTHRHGETGETVLGAIGLAFTCLFMLELIASIWASGWPFFYSRFHCFDALVVLASFIVDVVLRGVLEEIGSLVIALRLFRVLKIIDELSAGAAEQMEDLQARIELAEEQNASLKAQLRVFSKIQAETPAR